MAIPQISGLASGLDTSKIIDGLLAIDQARITRIQNQQGQSSQDLAAFKGIEAKLLALQSQVFQLARPQNNVFDARTVSSSDENLVTAAASSAAAPGVYSLHVTSLARVQETASQGFDSTTSAITQGTLHIKLNSGAATTITIDSSNNTLQGLADAINNANAGVTASIINDGSDSRTQPYRLLLTAAKAGTDNGFTIVNDLAADSGGARRVELGSTFINDAVTSSSYTGTAVPNANVGAGTYTGTSNNTYLFTVATGGTVGTDNGITLNYTDSTGTNTGTITLNSGDAGVFKNVAQGIQVKLGAGTLNAGDKFTVDAFVPTVQQAGNAAVTLGSGDGALTVQSATNQIDNLIHGVTLNLNGADPSKEVTLSISKDTAKSEKAVTDFVDAYNEVIKFVDQQVQYDPASQKGGPLLGDGRPLLLEQQVRDIMANVVPGLPQQMNRLSALGIRTDQSGQLVVDKTKLEDALAGRIPGASADAVRSVFSLAGVSTNPAIQFVTGSDQTNASGEPIQVVITQAAQQAAITAANALAATTVINSSNNTVTITVDGVTSNVVTLAQGSYSQTALAQELQAEINKDSTLAGRQVQVGLNGGELSITSNTYGSASQVALAGGTAISTLGFLGTENNHGQDVAGKFVVNGQDEAAMGRGQFLTGIKGNHNTDGLMVRSLLSASQIPSGPAATVTATRGVASQLAVALNNILDPLTGRMQNIEDSVQSNIDYLQKRIDEQNKLLDAKRQFLEEQFVTMETTISQLQSTSNYLGSQLTSFNIPKTTGS